MKQGGGSTVTDFEVVEVVGLGGDGGGCALVVNEAEQLVPCVIEIAGGKGQGVEFFAGGGDVVVTAAFIEEVLGIDCIEGEEAGAVVGQEWG